MASRPGRRTAPWHRFDATVPEPVSDAIAPPGTGPTSAGTITVAIAAATTGVLPVFLTGALAVSLRHALALSSTTLGIAVATFFAASALCSASAGRRAERHGALPLMRAAALCAVVSLGAVPLVARNAGWLAACLALGGVANGVMQPAVNLLLTRVVPSNRQGLAFGVKQAGIPTATLLSGLAVPALAVTVGWRDAYLAAASLGLVVLGVLRRFDRHHRSLLGPTLRTTDPDPKNADPKNAAQQNVDPQNVDVADPSRPPSATVAFDPRPLALLAVAMACAVAAANALGSFVVSSAVSHGVTASTAGLLSALGSAAGLSARVLLGWRADSRPGIGRTDRRGEASQHLRRVALLVALGTGGYLLLATGSRVLLVPAVLLAFAAGWGFNGLFNLAVVRSHPHAPARATGITQVGTYIGGMVGPLGFGVVADHAGYDAAWLVAAGLAATGAVTFVAGRSLLAHAIRPDPARSVAASATPSFKATGSETSAVHDPTAGPAAHRTAAHGRRRTAGG
jgi:MFS family permease